MTKSKFSFYPYFQIVLSLALLITGVVTFRKIPSNFMTPPFLFPALLAALGLGLLYFALKRTILVRIEPDRINLRNAFLKKTVLREDIASIELFARKVFRPFDIKEETLALGTKEGKRYYVVDHDYRNMQEMRRALFLEYAGKLVSPGKPVSLLPGQESIRPAPTQSAMQAGQKFPQNFFAGYAGRYVCGICAAWLLVLLVMLSAKQERLLFTLLGWVSMGAAWYVLFGMTLFYFKVSDEGILVGNHFFFWYKRTLGMDDILGAVLEMRYRNSKYLRIRTIDFRSRSYHAESLRMKDWRALAECLRGLGVPCQDELDY